MCASVFFFFKQKTAYEMRISDWSSDVCSSDLFTDEDEALLRQFSGVATPGMAEIVDELRAYLHEHRDTAALLSGRDTEEQVEQNGRAPRRERVRQYV